MESYRELCFMLCCCIASATPFEEWDVDESTLKSAKVVRRDSQEDTNASPFIFESSSLPMLDSSIDYRYMPFVGNGHIATTVYSDAVYMNGVFNGQMGKSHRARIPSTNAIRVDFQAADDRQDTTRTYQLKVQEGQWVATLEHSEVVVDVTIYAHQHYHHLLVSRVTVRRAGGEESGREFVFTLANNYGEPSQDIDFSEERQCDGINVPGFNCKYITGVIKETETTNSERTRVHVFYTTIPRTITLSASESSRSWLYVTSIGTDENKARKAYANLKDLSPSILDFSHLQSWRRYWDSGRVEIEGDLTLRKVLYGSQYFIKSSLPAPETDQSQNDFHGVSPGGLGRGALGMDYQGHVFWDMETWIYPAVLLLHPSAAKDMLNYRVNRMDPAYERAKAGGHQGLRFPWESAFTGVEVTPDVCVACRENEQHVTADIAFAARQYVAATRDLEWLQNQKGCEFIIDMAKFWVSRAEYDRGRDRYHIRDVMPPDEYHTKVDDSVFTNVGASLSIHMANYTACLCEEQFPEEWHDVATKLRVLYDEDMGYHPEFDGYSPDDMTFNDVSNKSNNIVKQADVILIGFPFMFQYMDRETRRNDLNIYREVTDPLGPAMTWAMFSIGYREIGDDAQQQETFEDSFKPYVREPFKVWTEAQSGMGASNFLTGMGGFLQTIIFGYGGFRLLLESLYFNTTLPPGSTSLTIIDMDYMGARLNLQFKNDEMSIEVVAINDEFPLELELFDDESIVSLQAGSEKYVYTMQPGRFYTTTPSGCPLPVDGIIPEISEATSFHRTHFQLCIILIFLLICWYAAVRRSPTPSRRGFRAILHRIRRKLRHRSTQCITHVKSHNSWKEEQHFSFHPP